MPELIVHHLQVSQSDRIVWLCEELDIPYTLRLHKRDPMLSPQSIKDLHPIGAAPIIQDGSVTLAESEACAEWIIHKHGNGRLTLPPDHKDYATYLYWYHFANGSLQPGIGRYFTLAVLAKVDPSNEVCKRIRARMLGYFEHLDKHLGEITWLAGDEFTLADIMTVFTCTTMRVFCPVDLSPFPNILAWLKRASARPAYQKARDKADPGMELMIDGPPPKPFRP